MRIDAHMGTERDEQEGVAWLKEQQALRQRYRAQTWWVRRWRDRYYALVPFWAAGMWWWSRSKTALMNPARYATHLPFDMCWDVALGHLDVKRKNWATAKEAGMEWLDGPEEETRDH